jgi:MinD-like ATPase involved in chromosome partitioning or flagellar assembly
VTLVALCSGKGSPGVSTLACVAGAVWPSNRRIVIAECDPSGNDLATRFGLSPRRGMTSLVLAHRRSEHSEDIVDIHSQRLPGGLEALVGPVGQDAASSLDRELGVVGAGTLPADVDMLVDLGRILSGAPGQRAILQAADQVVMVTKSDEAALAHALRALDVVREIARGQTSFVVVGQSRYRMKEIEHALRSESLGRIPIDEASAAMACGSPGRSRRFVRGDLVTAARQLVSRLLVAPHTDDAYDLAARKAGEHLHDVAIDSLAKRALVELAPSGENGKATR